MLNACKVFKIDGNDGSDVTQFESIINKWLSRDENSGITITHTTSLPANQYVIFSLLFVFYKK